MTPRQSVVYTVTGTVVSVIALAYAEIALPLQPLLSDYALVPGGMAPVLVGMLALAGACLGLAYGLATSDPVRTAATRVLLLAGAGGLMMSAIFPTDPGTSQIGTLSGEIHRWSAAVVFTSLPVAGWTLARRRETAPRWNAVKAMSVTAAVTLAVYLAAHPAAFTSPWINGVSFYGPLERGVVLADMALLVVMALAAFTVKPAVKTQMTPANPAGTVTGTGTGTGTGTEAGPQERLAA